jgi:peptidoglycan/LPS O-acetylase OafA/YrhL
MPELLNLRGSGRAGVVLFFFLSAFLISGPFLSRRREALAWRTWITYAISRLFRIVPLYYVTLLLLFFAGLDPFNQSPSLLLLARHLLFQEGLSVFWTIVVEMRFYLVLPFFLIGIACVSRVFRSGHIIAFCAGSLWILGVAMGFVSHDAATRLGIDKHAPVFVSGVLTSLMVFGMPELQPNNRQRRAFELCAWGLAALIVFVSVPAFYYGVTQGVSISTYSASSAEYERFWDARIPWIGSLIGPLFYSFRNGSGPMLQLLAWRPLAWVGQVSFGLYLIHLQVIHEVERHGVPHALRFVVALAGSLLLAWMFHWAIEQPGIRLGRRLGVTTPAGPLR